MRDAGMHPRWPTVRLVAVGLALGSISALTVGLSMQQAAQPARNEVDTRVAGVVEFAHPTDAVDADHLAVVEISVTRCGQRASGTGVLVDSGVVITAAHVVGDAALVRLDHGSQVLTGEVIGVASDGRDLALIAVDGPLDEPVRAGAAPAPGDPLTVIGHPSGFGLVTAVGRRVDVDSSMMRLARGPAFAVDVATAPGMSGSPVLDADGALVGIVIGAETTSTTAIVLAIDDAAAVASSRVRGGTCPISA